jgi:glycosyltransferase involved in cell wall biosynthesis
VELGVSAERCAVVPHGYSPEALTADGADDRYRAHGTVFLAITNSHDLYRYGTDVLLEAYRRAFSARDDVVLVLKDYGVGAEQSLLGRWLRDGRSGPRIVHLTDFLDKSDLIRLYRGADFFVAPYRGEGFGMKVLDAFAVGLPVLLPEYGGPVDYLVPGTYYPLRHRPASVGECYDRKYSILPECARWVEVDVDDLVQQLRAAAGHKDAARRRAQQAREHVLKNYSWRRAAECLRDALIQFEGERRRVVAPRRLDGPPEKKLSVIIPTYNRADALRKCLAAYREQTLPADEFEMILVDDGSTYPVADLVRAETGRLPVRLLANDRNRGPAFGRNRGIEAARGELVLFTGDDIIPEPAFLAEHVRAHAGRPDAAAAALGYTYWHPDVRVTPLMHYITEEGGQQFYYNFLRPYQAAPYNCFYTSNLSLKRAFLVGQEQLFSTRFPYAAFEDVEFAQRLSRRGLALTYHPPARAGHLHPMTDAQIYERQYKAGRMLLVFLLLHPEQRPQEYMPFLDWLEVAQHVLLRDPNYRQVQGDLECWSESFGQWLGQSSAAAEGLARALTPDRYDHDASRVLLQRAGGGWQRCRKDLYAYRLDLELHRGLADEWMGVKAGDPNPVRDLASFYLCTGEWGLLDRNVPEFQPSGLALREMHAGRMLRLARRLRHHPWLVPLWGQVKRLPGVRTLKGATKRMLHLLA